MLFSGRNSNKIAVLELTITTKCSATLVKAFEVVNN